MVARSQPEVSLTRIETFSSWHLHLLPVLFPMKEKDRKRTWDFLEMVADRVAGDWKLEPTTFFQSWKLQEGECAAKIEANLKSWNPIPGLGVWPGRQPPSKWTQESFMNASAAMLQKAEPERSSYKVLHLDGSERACRDAAKQLFGYGGIVQMFSARGFKALREDGASIFLPQIADAAFRHERFYMPLLERGPIESATNDQLTSWLCGAEMYVRESAEDKGVLILSRQNPAMLFDLALTALDATA